MNVLTKAYLGFNERIKEVEYELLYYLIYICMYVFLCFQHILKLSLIHI